MRVATLLGIGFIGTVLTFLPSIGHSQDLLESTDTTETTDIFEESCLADLNENLQTTSSPHCKKPSSKLIEKLKREADRAKAEVLKEQGKDFFEEFFEQMVTFGLSPKDEPDKSTAAEPDEPTDQPLAIGLVRGEIASIPSSVWSIQSQVDDLQINKVIINRGNCKKVEDFYKATRPLPFMLGRTYHEYPVTLKFGEMIGIMIDEDCRAIEIAIETNYGSVLATPKDLDAIRLQN
jgi:hypothetical protein